MTNAPKTFVLLFVFTDAQLDLANSDAVEPVAVVINADENATLECLPAVMRLTISKSKLAGHPLDDFLPLKSDCIGFEKTEDEHTFYYSVPLAGCGAEIKVCQNQFLFHWYYEVTLTSE